MPTAARDFPFHDGQPFAPTRLQWGLALLSVAVGLSALLYGTRLTGQAWPGVVAFVGLPLAGLAILCRGHLALVFARPTPKDMAIGIGFGLLNLVTTGLVGWLVSRLLQTAANPVDQTLKSMPAEGLTGFFALTGVQLVGEELVTVIPFLAVLALARHLGLGRGPSVLIATLAAAALFAAMHFPTYQWHMLQTLLVIGIARVVLFAAWLTTKTLWASVIAHVLNDWVLFGGMILLTRLTA